MKKLLYYLTFLLSLHTFVSKAQVLDYVILNQEQGLTTTFIHCLYIDSRGIQWVGTGGHGLLRYDGKQYVKINESFGIDSYNITGIIEDKKGNLILKVLNYGLIVFDGIEIVKKIPIPNKNLSNQSSRMTVQDDIVYIITENSLFAVDSGKEYNISLLRVFGNDIKGVHFNFFSTPNKELYVINNEVITRLTLNATIKYPNDIKGNKIIALYQKSGNEIYAGLSNGDIIKLWVNDLNELKFKVLYQKIKSIKESIFLSSNIIVNDDKNMILVGSNDTGIVLIENGKINIVNTSDNFPGINLNQIVKDKSGNFYFPSVGKGIIKIPTTKFYNYRDIKETTYPLTFGIIRDQENIILSDTRRGIFSFREDENGILTFNNKVENRELSILNFYRNRKNEILALGKEIYKYDVNKNELSEINIKNAPIAISEFRDLIQLDNGNYFASYVNGIVAFDSDFEYINHFEEFNNKPLDVINAIKIYNENTLIFGGTSGIYTLNLNKVKYKDAIKHINSLPITGITKDQNNTLWFCNNIDLVTFSNNTFKYHSNYTSASTKNIYTIAPIGENQLLIGSNFGVQLVTINEKSEIIESIPYSHNSGFQGLETNGNFYTYDTNGNLFFNTTNGLYKYITSSPFENQYSYKPIITKISLTDKEIIWNDNFNFWSNTPNQNYIFENDDNNLKFAITSNYTNNNSYTFYSHKLIGNDHDWSLPSNNDEISYTNLKYGDYELLIRIVNENGKQIGEVLSYKFSIKTPVYFKLWFILPILFFTFLGGFFLYKNVQNYDDDLSKNFFELSNNKTEIKYYFLFMGLYILFMFLIDFYFISHNGSPIFFKILICLMCLLIYKLSSTKYFYKINLRNLFFYFCLFYYIYSVGILFSRDITIVLICQAILAVFICQTIFKTYKDYVIFTVLNVCITVILYLYKPENIQEVFSLFFSIIFLLIVNYVRRISILNTKENFVFAHNIINSSNAISIAINKVNEITFVGNSILTITGYTVDEVINQKLDFYTNKPFTISDNSNNLNVELTTFKCKNGDIKYIQWSIKKYSSKLTLCIGQDITTRILLEEQYKNIIQFANDIICETSIDGTILFANNYAEVLLGYSDENIVGINYKTIVPKEFHKKIENNIKCILESNESINRSPAIEYQIITKSNQLIWVSQRTRIKRDISGYIIGFISILRDITHEKELLIKEKKREEYLKLLNATINEISTYNFTSFTSKSELIKIISEKVLPILKVNRLAIWYAYNEGFELISLYDNSSKSFFKGDKIKFDLAPNYIEYIKNNLYFVSNENSQITSEINKVYGDIYGIKSFIDIPFFSKGQLDGLITFESSLTNKHWNTDEIVFCKNVVDVIVIGLANIKRYEAERLTIYKSEILTTISKTTHLLLSSKTIADIFKSSLQHIGKAAMVDRIYFFESDNDKKTISQSHEWVNDNVDSVLNMEELQNLSWSFMPDLIEQLKNNTPYIEIVDQIKEHNTRLILDKQQIKSILILPIFVQNNFYGFIGFDDCKSPREWSIDEINILVTFANNVQAAIERILIEKSTKESEEKFRLLANNIPAGVYLFDYRNKSRKIYFNSKIQTITGYSQADFERDDLKISDLYHIEEYEKAQQIIQKAIQNKTPYYITGRLINKYNEIIWFEEFGEGIYENDVLQFIQGVIIDITERKNAESAIRVKEIAEASSESKMKFLANMSHEIRTPLNGIIGFADLLNKTPLNSVQLQYVEVVNQSSKALLEVVNDILDFSKIEADKLEVEILETNLYELIDQVIDMNKYNVHKKNLNFIVNISDSIPQTVWIDNIRVKQILVNLLSNAVKFTSEGYVELGIIMLYKTDDECNLKFYVKDTGIGVKKENRQKIFDVFTQEDSSTTRTYGGTGLGLPISNKLLFLMNSKIEVTDNPSASHGSEFSFVLNLKYGLQSPNLYKIPDSIKNVLIIDTVNENSIYLAEALNKLNIKTFIENQEQRIYLHKNTTDFIFGNFDITDPKIMNEVISWNIPVISAINSITNTNHLKEYKNVIRKVKPLKTYELKNYFKEALQTIDSPLLPESPQTFTTINDALKIIIVEDNKVNMLLTTTLITKLLPNAQVIKAYNGQEGIELHQSNNADVILMDIQMPIKNGYDATKEIRNFDKKTVIIALTAAIIKDEADKCFESGMNDYISKPIDRLELYAKLEYWIEKTRKTSTN